MTSRLPGSSSAPGGPHPEDIADLLRGTPRLNVPFTRAVPESEWLITIARRLGTNEEVL